MQKDINSLREQAKELGINSFGKGADKLREEIAAKLEAEPTDTPDAEETAEVTETPPATKKQAAAAPRRDLSDNQRASDRAAQIRKDRKTRGIDMTALNYKLAFHKKEDGYEYHWVNDVPGRIQGLENKGWERVEEEPRVVSRQTGLKAYLMRIPSEIYSEDAAARQKRIDDQEDQMLHGINKDSDSVERNRIAGSATIKRGMKVKKVSF